jgi:catechol-2,3-dioxygenase
MTITGIDAVTYGVGDLAKATAFFTDFGLNLRTRNAGRVVLTAANGAEVVLRPRTARDLPPAFERKPTLRTLTFGVASRGDLSAIARALGRDRDVAADPDGTLHALDDHGIPLAFRVSRRRPLTGAATAVNAPGAVARIDRRATYYERAIPRAIGHVVLAVPDRERARRFYERRLGFQVSDFYRGRGVFMRSGTLTGHHTLFFLESADTKVSLNHVAYSVRDIHELFAGGLHMTGRGWKTAIGPGRHRISSAYFWYFKNPAGGLAEYYWDEDFATAKWRPKTWDPAPTTFAEWVLGKGLPRSKALPPTREKRDAKPKGARA